VTGCKVVVFDTGELGPDLIERRSHYWADDARLLAATIRWRNGDEQQAVAMWPRDIPPPRLNELD